MYTTKAGTRTIARQRWEAQQRKDHATQALMAKMAQDSQNQRNAAAQALMVAAVGK